MVPARRMAQWPLGGHPVYPSAIPMSCRLAVVLVAVLAAAACRSAGGAGTPIVQPGAPGEANRVLTPEAASDLSKVQATPADVKFMQGMIGHHAQAIEMTALIASRTSREEMKLLGQRIAVSQADEMDMMRSWLRARGQEIPSEHAHHTHEGMMPGMLTPEQMAELTAATGEAFDKLFLRYMIQHHEGALSMVDDLFKTPGAGQEGDINAFAADVDSDQRMEIDRMRALLGSR
jgi:uncharacterized protein (DUF305 family)